MILITNRKDRQKMKEFNKTEKLLIKYSLQEFYYENVSKGNNDKYKQILKDLIYKFKN